MIYKNSTLIRSIIVASCLVNIGCVKSGANNWEEATDKTIRERERQREEARGNSPEVFKQKEEFLIREIEHKAQQDNIKKGIVK